MLSSPLQRKADRHSLPESYAPQARGAAPIAALQRKGYQAQLEALSPGAQSLDVQLAALSPTGAAGVQQAAAQGVAGSGGSLPFLGQIQASFGSHDVSKVQAYQGGAAQAACQSIGARGYAADGKVAFNGSPDLHTAAHEAAHVVQQRGGVQLKGGVGQVGDRYERHADAVADLVVQGKSAEGLLSQMAGGSGGGSAVQLRPGGEGPKKKRTKTTREETEKKKTKETKKTTETVDKTKSDESKTVDEGEIRLRVKLRIEEMKQCTDEKACASKILALAKELGCSPRLIRKIWLETEAGKKWRRERRRKRRQRERRKKTKETTKKTETTKTKKETKETTEETGPKTKEEEKKELCDPKEMDALMGFVDSQVRTRMNSMAIVKLAQSQGMLAAIQSVHMDAKFASEFDATPHYKKALAKAFFGSVEGQIQKATMKFVPGPGKAVGKAIFKFVDTLVAERRRAMAAAKDRSVKLFLQNALKNNVGQLSTALVGLVKKSEIRDTFILAMQSQASADCRKGRTDVRQRLLVTMNSIQKSMEKAFAIKPFKIKNSHKQALKYLLSGVVGNGYIDHGHARVACYGKGAGPYRLHAPTDLNNPPKLKGTANNGGFADGISQWIKHYGGSINSFPIEKRIRLTVNFKNIGDVFVGEFMEGSGKWSREGAWGNASIHPVALTNKHFKNKHFEIWKQAKNNLRNHINIKKVTA